MLHPSYGSHTPEQIAEAMAKPFGQTQPYLAGVIRQFCPHCSKPQKDIQAHFAKAKTCGQREEAQEEPTLFNR